MSWIEVAPLLSKQSYNPRFYLNNFYSLVFKEKEKVRVEFDFQKENPVYQFVLALSEETKVVCEFKIDKI